MLFVAGRQITDEHDVPLESANTKPYVKDNVVRDFDNWAEARAYQEGRTDYLGNLPGPNEAGTWVRFHDDRGLNIVGEDHTYIKLVDVAKAVRLVSFTYEPFATDALLVGSAFRAAYLAENQAELASLGVDPNGPVDLTLIGGESLHPKIGYVLTSLRQFLQYDDVEPLTSGNGRYTGKPFQRYVKIGWGWAKDLVNKLGKTANENALVTVVNTWQATLDPFITALAVDGYLGDALEVHTNVIQPLLAFCQAYIPVLIERAHNDAGLSVPERQTLTAMPTGTGGEIFQMFALWRNLYFGNAVAAAAARGVRYAGMGDKHRIWLMDEKRIPPGAHTYSTDPKFFIATLADNCWLRP